MLIMDNGSGEHEWNETRGMVVLTDVGGLNEEGIHKPIKGFRIFNKHNNNFPWMDDELLDAIFKIYKNYFKKGDLNLGECLKGHIWMKNRLVSQRER